DAIASQPYVGSWGTGRRRLYPKAARVGAFVDRFLVPPPPRMGIVIERPDAHVVIGQRRNQVGVHGVFGRTHVVHVVVSPAISAGGVMMPVKDADDVVSVDHSMQLVRASLSRPPVVGIGTEQRVVHEQDDWAIFFDACQVSETMSRSSCSCTTLRSVPIPTTGALMAT